MEEGLAMAIALLAYMVVISVIGLPEMVLCATLKSVPDLENAMYHLLDGTPCVRVLNLTGEIGCANPGRAKVVAPIVGFSDLSMDLNQPAAILLPPFLLTGFLTRTLNEPLFAKNVAGLLVEYSPDYGDITRGPPGFSDDEKFPQSAFAMYQNKSYVWNPFGTGIMWNRYNFPVFLLSEESTTALREVAADNEKRNLKYPMKVAEFDVVMQTTKSGTHSSKTCLEEWSCLPLGGYSVWSSLPPIDALSTSSKKPILLAMSSMDSASFFRDKTPGSDSPLSGMIAMLAAADALSKTSGIDKWKKQLVFIVFTGEAWGYLGSRRFLSALAAGESSVKGLDGSLIQQILEVGSVGRAAGDPRTFYAHSQGTQTSASQEIWEALQNAASSFGVQNANAVQVNLASKSNPGIPPSSLMSFLHKNESTSGVLITEFDTSFRNFYYHSRFDDSGNINTTAITTASSLIARTLYMLVNDVSNSSTAFQAIVANYSLVEELVNCLLTCSPGTSCNLVKSLITPRQACINHYVGVFLGDPSTEPVLGNIDDTSRFVWNFLASHTVLESSNTSINNGGSECSTSCDNAREACVGSTVEHKGICVVSTTRYVPAYSTRLHYESTGWVIVPPAQGDKMDEVDPVYTESFWKVLSLRVYTKESSYYDHLVLLIGLMLTVGSFFIILSTRAVYRKRLKLA